MLADLLADACMAGFAGLSEGGAPSVSVTICGYRLADPSHRRASSTCRLVAVDRPSSQSAARYVIDPKRTAKGACHSQEKWSADWRIASFMPLAHGRTTTSPPSNSTAPAPRAPLRALI